MSDPTLAELFTPATSDGVFSSMLTIAQQVGLPATAWQPISVGREILAITAQEIANFSVIAQGGAAAGGLLDFATGDWLTLLAISNFGVPRISATFGTTQLTLTNSSAVSFTFAAGDIIFLNSRTGETYTNTTGGNLAASGGTLVVSVIANDAGSIANANPGEISELQTPLLGVTCTNAAALVGNDEQSDDDLRQLCRESMAKASPNGPRDAYNYFAKTATRPDGSNVGITRVRVIQNNGSNDVYVADADGIVTGTINPDGSGSGDLYYVDQAIKANCVPTGLTETTHSAIEHDILITADVYVRSTSTLSVGDAQTEILDQLTQYFKTIPIGGYDVSGGGYVFLDAVISQIFQAAPNDIVQAVITSLTADEAMGPTDVGVLTSVATSFNIIRAVT